jgi:hypothetical protein
LGHKRRRNVRPSKHAAVEVATTAHLVVGVELVQLVARGDLQLHGIVPLLLCILRRGLGLLQRLLQRPQLVVPVPQLRRVLRLLLLVGLLRCSGLLLLSRHGVIGPDVVWCVVCVCVCARKAQGYSKPLCLVMSHSSDTRA